MRHIRSDYPYMTFLVPLTASGSCSYECLANGNVRVRLAFVPDAIVWFEGLTPDHAYEIWETRKDLREYPEFQAFGSDVRLV